MWTAVEIALKKLSTIRKLKSKVLSICRENGHPNPFVSGAPCSSLWICYSVLWPLLFPIWSQLLIISLLLSMWYVVFLLLFFLLFLWFGISLVLPWCEYTCIVSYFPTEAVENFHKCKSLNTTQIYLLIVLVVVSLKWALWAQIEALLELCSACRLLGRICFIAFSRL